MEQLKDWRGTSIEVGDTIMYAVKASTSVDINEGIVAGFGTREGWLGEALPTILVDWVRSNSPGWDHWRKVTRVTLGQIKNVTVLAKAALPVDEQINYHEDEIHDLLGG